jgi:hypothetical protein
MGTTAPRRCEASGAWRYPLFLPLLIFFFYIFFFFFFNRWTPLLDPETRTLKPSTNRSEPS